MRKAKIALIYNSGTSECMSRIPCPFVTQLESMRSSFDSVGRPLLPMIMGAQHVTNAGTLSSPQLPRTSLDVLTHPHPPTSSLRSPIADRQIPQRQQISAAADAPVAKALH